MRDIISDQSHGRDSSGHPPSESIHMMATQIEQQGHLLPWQRWISSAPTEDRVREREEEEVEEDGGEEGKEAKSTPNMHRKVVANHGLT